MSQTIGRYVLEKRLAAGGMGEVHLARQTGPDGFERECVVKTVHTSLASQTHFVKMFLEEAQLTAHLNHPHIAQVYDFGKVGEVYFLAMELVNGPSLHQVLRHHAKTHGFVPIDLTLRIVSQAAQALDYVHRRCGLDGKPLGIIHRDISPGNILLSKDGLVKVIDFGIAKANRSAAHTQIGEVRGKVAYMSPEQLLSEPLDGRTDVFSLGLVMYELLTNRRAVPGKKETELLRNAVAFELPPVGSLRANCPPLVRSVLERALQKHRSARYQTAGDFSEELEMALASERMVVTQGRLAKLAQLVASTDTSPGQLQPTPQASPPVVRRGEVVTTIRVSSFAATENMMAITDEELAARAAVSQPSVTHPALPPFEEPVFRKPYVSQQTPVITDAMAVAHAAKRLPRRWTRLAIAAIALGLGAAGWKLSQREAARLTVAATVLPIQDRTDGGR